MSSEKLSKNNRTTKTARSFKEKLSSLLHLPRPPTPSLIDVNPSSDNHITTTDAGTSNFPLAMVPVVDRAPATVVSRTDVHGGPVSNQGPETPPMNMSPNIQSPVSLFHGARNIYLHQPVFNMASSIQHVSNAEGNEHSRFRTLNILREKLLPRAQFAEYDAASPAPRNACTENTRKTILDALGVWASNNTTTKVYWLNGMAGTGKTTIAYSFSEILDKKESLGGTFFSSHLRVDTSDVHCIIPTISLQLAKYLPSLSPLLLDVVENNPDCSSWRIGKQFLNFIVRPLTAAYRDSREGPVPVIVLDALDECSDQSLVAELLSMILKHCTSVPVKFFITSRPEMMLKETFDCSWDHSNFILHEVEKEIVKADIELYIKSYLLGGRFKYRHDWPPHAELEMLVNMSGTLFIYAATVCKYITQKGSSNMPQRLLDVVNFTLETTSGLTQPLDILYERILDAAYAFTNQKERLNINLILQAVVYAYNPLSITAISALMQIPREHTVAALSSLHSLIYIPSEDPDIPISTFHASFHDFISNQILSSKYYLDPCASHKFLAFKCLSLMEKEWSGKETVAYLAERKCEEISEPLAYACSSWAFHFAHANADDYSESAELKQFFQKHLLRWMDCLSILGNLGTAMNSLYKLEKWANTQKLWGMTVAVMDAKRFLKENFDFVKKNSLEGCPSALAWLPRESNIWKTYGSKMDCPWKLCMGRREAWSLCEAVLAHSQSINSAVFSPDGMHIVSASYDCIAKIWNTATGECEVELKGHSESINSAVFSPDAMHIVTASTDHTARIWNTATGECKAELKGHSNWVRSALFSPDGVHIVSASQDHTARIWNAATGECEVELKGHSELVRTALFSPDGMHIATASNDNTARIWSTLTGECETELKGHSGTVNSAVFSPDGMHIVTSSNDNTARIWNTATGECEAELKGHTQSVRSAIFSPDGINIVSASLDQTARIWDTATGECKAVLEGHLDGIMSVVFSPDGMYIVSASEDYTAQIWDTATGECKAELKGHSKLVRTAVFSPDGMHIVTASADHTARIWNTAIEDSEEHKVGLKGHSQLVRTAVFSSDGTHIVSASDDCTARIWNTATGECEVELKGHSNFVMSAVFSFDGMHIVSASEDRTVRIWDTATGQCKAELKGHLESVDSAVFSPDGMHIVSISGDCARIWNTVTGECKAELKGHYWLRSAVFSPDGMHVVSASEDHMACIWNTATGECEAELEGHSGWVISAVFSSDNMHVVSVSADDTMRIWNTVTGQCEAELKHSQLVRSAVFSPDSMHNISAFDHTAQIWDTASKAKLHEYNSSSFSDNTKLISPLPNGVFYYNDSHGEIHLSNQLSFLDIYEDTIIHTKNLQKIWIPPLFCKPQSISHHLSKVCLGYASGEVLVIEYVD